ncbi:MAG TPA: 3-methyl-2-oxobutanoate hydroxymethyltransferase [Dissulfurispiraceae bacterium]|nr:3-methyl-2-oxobutanoate hydroxymethyltransferase [Dissulfurispiraceae bacterium]
MAGRVTIQSLQQKKDQRQKISMITAYDYPFAQIAEEAGVDAIIVGDSLAIVVQGHDTTLPVSMDEMIYHTKMVSRASTRTMVIADMPYLSYQVSTEEAVRNAGRFLKEAGAHAVKLEGGSEAARKVEALTKAEIPVMAHIGLMPQAILRMGGYKLQGRTEEEAKRLAEDAKLLEGAGAFSIILEAVPAALAQHITGLLAIPTIGIGGGPYCDGQVLVMHDVLGMFDRFVPKFIKKYANLKHDAIAAVTKYREEVENGIFPGSEQSF